MTKPNDPAPAGLGELAAERLEEIRALDARPVELADAVSLRQFTDATRDLLAEVDRLRALAIPAEPGAKIGAERLLYMYAKSRRCGPLGEDLRQFSDDEVAAIIVSHQETERDLAAQVLSLTVERDGARAKALEDVLARLRSFGGPAPDYADAVNVVQKMTLDDQRRNQGLSPQCRYCTGPNTELSTGGPDVCVLCEVHGVEPKVWMGHRAPYDFHAGRRSLSRTEKTENDAG